jgi:hypothetical protein
VTLTRTLAAGTAFAVPASDTDYDYIDVFFRTTPLGTISITDANALRPAGTSWKVDATVTADPAPAAGRVLYGTCRCGRTLSPRGSGDVIIESVSP